MNCQVMCWGVYSDQIYNYSDKQTRDTFTLYKVYFGQTFKKACSAFRRAGSMADYGPYPSIILSDVMQFWRIPELESRHDIVYIVTKGTKEPYISLKFNVGN